MTVKLLTLSVQIGSGGHLIGRTVARELGYRYYDWEITSSVAAKVGVSPDDVASAERWPRMRERIVQWLASTALWGSPGLPEPVATSVAISNLMSSSYRAFIESVVRDLAGRGDAVIVGHAAQAILKDCRTGMLKVLVRGSRERRAERLMADRDLDQGAALATIDESDRGKLEFFRHVYRVEWLDAALYDLTIDTDRLPEEAAAEIIVQAARATTC